MNELNTVFRTVFKNPGITIVPGTTAADIREWDSLTHMILIAEIESYFGVGFSFEEVVGFRNVGDVALTIQNKVS